MLLKESTIKQYWQD